MYVPIIPIISTARNVANKTIVHADSIIPLKELGENIISTEVTHVNDYNYLSTVNKICELNPTVTFHTIQYSKENEQIIFYTNNKINLSEYYDWVKKTKITYLSASKSKRLVDAILAYTEITELVERTESTVSLFDFANTIDYYVKGMYSRINSMVKTVSSRVGNNNSKYAYMCDNEMDKGIISFIISTTYSKVSTEVYVGMNNGLINVIKTENNDYHVDSREFFKENFEEISEIYTLLMSVARLRKLIPYSIQFFSKIEYSVYIGESVNVSISNVNSIFGEQITLEDRMIAKEKIDYYEDARLSDVANDIFKKIPVDISEMGEFLYLFEIPNEIQKKSIWMKLKELFYK